MDYFKITKVKMLKKVLIGGIIIVIGATYFLYEKNTNTRIEGPFFSIILPEKFTKLSIPRSFIKNTENPEIKYMSGCKIFPSANHVADSNIMCVREYPGNNEEYVTFAFSRLSNEFVEKAAGDTENYLKWVEESDKKISAQVIYVDSKVVTSGENYKKMYYIYNDRVYIIHLEIGGTRDDYLLLEDLWSEVISALNTIEYKN